MSQSNLLQESGYFALSAGGTWLLPIANQPDVIRYFNACALLAVDSFSGAGTVDISLQSALTSSQDDNAWTTVASVTGISSTGPRVLFVGDAATNALLGVMRLKVVCNTAAVTLTLRAELLLKHEIEGLLREWLKPIVISFAGAGSSYMPADIWADCARFLHAFVLCEWTPATGSGANLTVALETAPNAAADSTSWATVNSATMTNSAANIDGRMSNTNPTMGVLRLKYTASAALSGTLRVMLLLKEA